MRMEIRAGEGGADAELFAQEFAQAVSKHSGEKVVADGTTMILECV